MSARTKPTPERQRRIDVSDRLFQLHGRINVEISQAVQAIMTGADIRLAVPEMCGKIMRDTEDLANDVQAIALKGLNHVL